MNSHQVQDIRLMYEAVYNEELREKAEEYNNMVYDENIVKVVAEDTNVFATELQREEYDVFDYLLEYLIAEGYADTSEAAIYIMANMSKEELDEATRLFYKLQKRGKGGSSTARAQLTSDADLEKQKNKKMRQQRNRQMGERERHDDRDHGSMSAAERNPSLR